MCVKPCVCVCMYVPCVFVSKHVSVCVCVHVPYVCVSVELCVNVCECMCECIYVCVSMLSHVLDLGHQSTMFYAI